MNITERVFPFPSYFLWILLLLFLFFEGGCGSLSKKQKDIALLHMQIGISHLGTGQHILALRELMKAHRLYPQSPAIQHQLGLAYFIRKKYLLAEKHLRKALALKKNFTDARNDLARVLIAQEKDAEALEQVHLVLQDLIYTDEERAWNNKGLAHLNLGQLKEAEKSFLRAVSLNPSSCLSYAYSGKVLYHLAKYKESQKKLSKAMENCQNSAFDTPLYYSALNHHRLGQWKQATQKLKKLVFHHPGGNHYKKAKALLAHRFQQTRNPQHQHPQQHPQHQPQQHPIHTKPATPRRQPTN